VPRAVPLVVLVVFAGCAAASPSRAPAVVSVAPPPSAISTAPALATPPHDDPSDPTMGGPGDRAILPPVFRVVPMPHANNGIDGLFRGKDRRFYLVVHSGYAFDDATDAIHPIESAIGPAIASHGSFGDMTHVDLVAGDPRGLPWVSTFDDKTFALWRFEDAAPKTRVKLSDKAEGTRLRWQSFDPPRAAGSYEESERVNLSQADLARLQKKQEEAAKHGIAVDYAATRTVEQRLYFATSSGGSTASHLLAKWTDRSGGASRPAIATTPREAAVVYWTESGRGAAEKTTLEARWFDWAGQATKDATLDMTPIMHADHAQVGIAGDGMTYVALAGSIVPPRAPSVQPFDAAGRPRTRVDLPLRGWITGEDFAAVRCAGSVWIIADEAVDHTLTVKAFRMKDGAIASSLVLGSHVFHEAQSTPNSRNGLLLYPACGEERIAVAFQVKDDMKDLDSTLAVYAEWDAR
jgi:hypothetical protein